MLKRWLAGFIALMLLVQIGVVPCLAALAEDGTEAAETAAETSSREEDGDSSGVDAVAPLADGEKTETIGETAADKEDALSDTSDESMDSKTFTSDGEPTETADPAGESGPADDADPAEDPDPADSVDDTDADDRTGTDTTDRQEPSADDGADIAAPADADPAERTDPAQAPASTEDPVSVEDPAPIDTPAPAEEGTPIENTELPTETITESPTPATPLPEELPAVDTVTAAAPVLPVVLPMAPELTEQELTVTLGGEEEETTPSIWSWLSDMWSWIFGRPQAEAKPAADKITIRIAGRLPKGATAKAEAIELTEEDAYFETALFAYEITVYDGDGAVFQPESDIRITVVSGKIKTALAEGKDIVVYRDSEDGDAAERLDTTAEKDSAAFAVSAFPVRAVVTAQVPVVEQTLTAAAEDTALALTGLLPEGSRAAAALAEAPEDAPGTILAAYDITLLDASGRSFQPEEGPVSVTLTSPAIARAASEGMTFRVYHVEEDGSLREAEVLHAEGDSLTFAADHFSTYVVRTVLEKILVASDGNTYRVTVTYDALTAQLPEEADLSVSEVAAEDADYAAYYARTAQALSVAESKLAAARMFDIAIVDGAGEHLAPASPVDVAIAMLDGALDEDGGDVEVVHFGAEPEVLDASAAAGADGLEVTFTAETFSVYVVAQTVLEKTITASDGSVYRITVAYDDTAGLPADAQLAVSEVPQDTEAYANYIARGAEPLGVDADSLNFLRVFDISILDPATGEHCQPETEVTVTIRLLQDTVDSQVSVVHFGAEAEVLDADVEGDAVRFQTSGFSAYAIVPGPGEVPLGWSKITTLDELRSFAQEGKGLYIGHTGGYYLRNSTYVVTGTRTGITKTKPAQTYPTDAAALYYFELVENTTDQFKIYCYNGENKQYVIQSTNSLNFTEVEADATAFTASAFPNRDATFRLSGDGVYYWNMQGGNSGNGFAAYNNANDGNAMLCFWYYQEIPGDPYQLNGKPYGLMNWNGGVTGKAMMAASSSANTLDALSLTVMSKLNNNEEKLFVPNDSDASLWTFQWIDNNNYYLTATVDDSTCYLKITASGLSLTGTPDESCKLQVVPGTGAHAGQICLKAGNTTLTYSGTASGGFSVGGSAGSEWLYLVQSSELTSEYFLTYSASKVSVSDESVTNGSRIIVYTRAWDDENKKYVFYAIDHDGTLVPCYESGDSIQWISGQINTMLWNLVEYYWEGTNDPNGFYELYNQYSEQYIAPQIKGDQILSASTIGINLTGRRNGYYYSTILAWDPAYQAYTGLKVENGRVVPCALGEADDFYFAVMQDLPVDDTLTTVPTVDHTQYGITMKLVDFSTIKKYDNSTTTEEQHNVLGDSNYVAQKGVPGLLSTNLGADGYPTAVKTNKSLKELFKNAQEVNHLFIGSTYSGSGYYEYDSTQNFAHLITAEEAEKLDDPSLANTFRVYKELGTMDGANKSSLKHGQFMPYNDLEAGVFASVNPKNLYSATLAQLPNSDPRKYEQMYLVRNPNYYFGVEIEASFTQTANGLDAWGHDIIYEFTGDDDFWLYVDGELIIDLGGIHSALPGSVNYSTGEVNVNGNETTLRARFEKNYRARNPDATEDEVNAYLAEYFNEGEDIFKDYTTHTMRIFFMERGAGASNLHMRFNLASVKPGTVLLSKELSGVDAVESVLAEYPYQIYYRLQGDEEDSAGHLLSHEAGESIRVVYKDSIKPVTYQDSFTIPGTELTYENVFLLKPGEVAEIDVPDKTIDYRIVECGVNTDVYSGVRVKELAEDVTPASRGGSRADYGIDWAETKDRPRVTYVNTVAPEALRTLTITKKLYKEDGETKYCPEYTADSPVFGLRLYLGTEFDTDLSGASMHTYHVKDPTGNYCKWDAASQTFTSLGKTVFSDLTAEEKTAATFRTSMYGSISKIPAFYTVEVRDVLIGTRFKVEERSYEIPDGYTLQKYVLYDDVKDTTKSTERPTDPVMGTFQVNKDPHVDVCNLRGWGLRVNKYWTDADYMAERDDTYFAVFTSDAGGNLTPVDGSVRRLQKSESTLYWFYLKLPVPNVDFDNYEIREVTLTGDDYTVDTEGVVTGASTVTPIAPGGELKLNGRQKGETASAQFTYTALYSKGTVAEGSNVRVDTVTNNRPGIVLKKTDWSGTPLAGATFTLAREADPIGTFTSDAEGQITVAFLTDNVEYTLTETKTPQGYHGLENAMTILLRDNQVTVTGVDEENYAVEQTVGATPTLTVKNRPYTFRVVKEDWDTGEKLKGVQFALHRQVSVDGVTNIEVNPMAGFENLVTDASGVVPKLDNTLPARTYELRETQALAKYYALASYIRFTVSSTGAVTLGAHPNGVDLTAVTDPTDPNGTLAYTLTVRNQKLLPAPTGLDRRYLPYFVLLLSGAGVLLLPHLSVMERGGKRLAPAGGRPRKKRGKREKGVTLP